MWSLLSRAAHLAKVERRQTEFNPSRKAAPFLSPIVLPSIHQVTQPVVGNSIATMLIPKADRKAIHEV